MRKKTESTRFIKDCIAESLIKLSENKNYEEITVKEICETAGIGRTTYYRYFSNKDGKTKCLEEYTFAKWKDYCEKKKEQQDKDEARIVFDFVYDNKEHFLWLNENHLTYIIFNALYNNIGPSLEEQSPIAFIKSFIAGGIYGVVYNWIQNEFAETPDEIARKMEMLEEEKIKNQSYK